MSSPGRVLAEIAQPTATPGRRVPRTPYGYNATLQRTGARLRSSRSARRPNADDISPASARGILRRLAKITAPVTRKRVKTPPSAAADKENLNPNHEDDENDVKKPSMAFDLEESLEDDDSEVLVAPTPSALLDDSDDDLEQPTITFDRIPLERHAREVGKLNRESLFHTPHSDPAVVAEDDDENHNDDENEVEGSTFLTERGRRAVSEEPTRMSRYSFGSIHMSEFGSELEIRRQSDRQQKLEALNIDDAYGEESVLNLTEHFGGETANLRHLQPSSPDKHLSDDENSHMLQQVEETFQLHFDEELGVEAAADERGLVEERPVAGTSILEPHEEVFYHDNASNEPEIENDQANNQVSMLLESVATSARVSRKKRQKLNRRGNMVPSLPSRLIKKVVHRSQELAGKRKTPLGKEHMRALEQATEWFFEQVAEDLEAYSSHGRRKKRIDQDDVLLLLRRQRKLKEPGALQKMAKEWLPRETQKELNLPASL